jgi:hypothetical protein
MSQSNRKLSHALKYSAIVMAVLCAFSLQPKPAAAGDGGAIAGALIGGVAAAIIAGQIANAARNQGVHAYGPRPRHVRAPNKDTTTTGAAVESKESSDPFAGTIATRSRPARGD